MSILLDDSTWVLVQGITGNIGKTQTRWMLDYGTKIVGGITPGKGGTTVEGVPVFDSVGEAVRNTGATASVFFVPAPFVLDAFYETVDAGIKFIVIVPEHVPVHDVMRMRAYIKDKDVFTLGPTTPGDSRSRQRQNGDYARFSVHSGESGDYLPERHLVL